MEAIIFWLIVWLLYQHFTSSSGSSSSSNSSNSSNSSSSSNGSLQSSSSAARTRQVYLSSEEALQRRAEAVASQPLSAFYDDHSPTLGHVETQLYYVSLYKRGRRYYKIGITAKRDVLERFRDEMEAGLSVSVLQTWRCSTRAHALKKEKYILELFDDHRLRRNGPLERGGNTEVFDEDVLGLHTSLNDEGVRKRASQAERYLERRA